MTTPIPPRAAAMLRERIAARERAEAALSEAVALVLASLSLPLDTRIESRTDGSMVAVPPEPDMAA